MKIRVFIIVALVIIVVVCAFLYFFREQPIGYGAETVDIGTGAVRVSRVVDSNYTDVSEQIDPAKLLDALGAAQSRRIMRQMSGYAIRDVMWEIDLVDREKGPSHVVLGKDSFWYVSGDEWFDIMDSEALIDEIDTLYEEGRTKLGANNREAD
jgi:hypothetical protein